MIKLTNVTRRGERVAVYINPRYIIRVSAAMNGQGDTVVEVEGSQYATWCSESVEDVMRLINEAREERA